MPLSLAEIRHLLGVILLHPPARWHHAETWSRWRRQHQATAQRCHYRRRARDPAI